MGGQADTFFGSFQRVWGPEFKLYSENSIIATYWSHFCFISTSLGPKFKLYSESSIIAPNRAS